MLCGGNMRRVGREGGGYSMRMRRKPGDPDLEREGNGDVGQPSPDGDGGHEKRAFPVDAYFEIGRPPAAPVQVKEKAGEKARFEHGLA